MLTPGFELRQNNEFLFIEIKAPYTKISDTEICVEENDFKFYSKPYYLRLNLPGNVIENGQEKAEYDADLGVFKLQFPKQTPGEVFEGLDMLTKLLAPSGYRCAAPPLVEVLGSSDESEEEDMEDFDWQIEQFPYAEDQQQICINAPTYGFANHRSQVFKRLQTEINDIIDLKDADSIPNHERAAVRLAVEKEHFDENYYLSDKYDNEDSIKQLLLFKPDWADDELLDFEKEQMRKLPRKEYILNESETRSVMLGLVDIIYAYCYDHRTTEGDSTVESGWTISKLSATLSWLEMFTSLRAVVMCAHRRSLIYPLYRHWDISHKIQKDTVKIFTKGKRKVLKCLLAIHRILMKSDPRYILNDLYITDYCVWIQSVRNRQIESLARQLSKIKLTKADLSLDLDILERAAEMAVEENAATTAISDSIQNISLNYEEALTLAAENLDALHLSGSSRDASKSPDAVQTSNKADKDTHTNSDDTESSDTTSSYSCEESSSDLVSISSYASSSEEGKLVAKELDGKSQKSETSGKELVAVLDKEDNSKNIASTNDFHLNKSRSSEFFCELPNVEKKTDSSSLNF